MLCSKTIIKSTKRYAVVKLREHREVYARIRDLNRSSHRRCSVKKVFLKKFSNIIKNGLQHKCFSVKFAKFLWKPILKNICKRPLLILAAYFDIILYLLHLRGYADYIVKQPRVLKITPNFMPFIKNTREYGKLPCQIIL